MTDLVSMLAMAAPAREGGGGGLEAMLVPMLIIFAIFYFMLIRPQQRKEKDRRSMIDGIKSGDKVVFAGGLMGTVTNVKESTFVIKIADNVKVEVVRSSVTQALDKGDKVSEESK